MLPKIYIKTHNNKKMFGFGVVNLNSNFLTAIFFLYNNFKEKKLKIAIRKKHYTKAYTRRLILLD